MAAKDKSVTVAAVCCMRNEAIFLLEWLAYQLVMGFDRVGVITNDCTDGTDKILDALSKADPRIVHVPNKIEPGEAPQVAGLRNARAVPELMENDYWLHCDADEFLNVTLGDGRVQDLLDFVGDVDCVALAWRPFGNSGIRTWDGGLVTERFTMADDRMRGSVTMHKCLFKPARFEAAIDHMPKLPVSRPVTLVNSKGEWLPPRAMFHPKVARFKGTPFDRLTWENASLHHYAVKARNVFLLKNLRGNGMGHQADRYLADSKLWKKLNKNKVEVPEARRHLGAVKSEVARLRAVGEVAAIEENALQAFRQATKDLLESQKTPA
ncbi:MAG: glycosyltransferase family 2 protein [Pseudomonadota bacterium]